MVILADELLQQFFEFSLAESIHIVPQIPGRASTFSLQTPTLTTFSGLNTPRLFAPSTPSFVPAGPSAPGMPAQHGVVPAKGIRGLLDNIVTDGMRVAAEVRKRMDEAQKELERSATAREDDYDEDEEDADARLRGFLAGNAPETGEGAKGNVSVRASDRDLLEGAEVGSIRENEGIVERQNADDIVDLLGDDTADAKGEKIFGS